MKWFPNTDAPKSTHFVCDVNRIMTVNEFMYFVIYAFCLPQYFVSPQTLQGGNFVHFKFINLVHFKKSRAPSPFQ